MHILELPSFFPPHGGLFCLEQAKALKALGHEVRIVSVVELGVSIDKGFFLTAPWREERREMEGVEACCYYMRAMPKAVRYNENHWISLCKKAVDRYVCRYGMPEVLHAHCCKNAGLAASEISQDFGIPFFITEHIPSGLYERDFGQGWQRHIWLKEKMRRTYELANCVIPVSRELVDDLAPYFGRDYCYHPISNIIDTDFFSFHEREPLINRSFRFCCLAVADIFRKGYDVLKASIAYLPENIEIHIVGKGTDSLPMQHLFAQSSNVHLYGHLDKAGVRDLLWKCDALVLPSRSEAQPLVILEALATGIPVVSTECIPSSLRIPGACRFAPIGDARALAEMMQEVMHVKPSPDFSETVRKIASPKVVAEKLTEIFKS